MTTRNPIGALMRRALVVSATASAAMLCGLPAAYAQDQNAKPDQLEEVVVTGSRISRPELEATVPTIVLGQDAFDAQGLENFADLATQLPSFAPAFGTSRTQSAFSGSVAAGLNEANLRNLGSEKTLTLLNGRRLPAGTPIYSSVDFNTIPTANIERVEIITGGAAAIYGADAVSGVVNLITKKNFEGIEFGASYGETSEGDNKNPSGYIMLGGNFTASGRGVLTLQVDNQGLVSCANRYLCAEDFAWLDPATQRRGPTAYSAVGLGGRFQVGGAAGGGFVARRNGAFVPFDVTIDGYNRNAARNIAIPTKRVMLAAEGEFVFNEQATAFLEINYGQVKTDNTIEGQPFQSTAAGNLVGGGPGVTGLQASIPIDNPFIPAAVRATYLSNFPTGTAINWQQRFNNLGGLRGSTNDRNTVRVAGGFKGDFEALGKGFNWEISHVYGRTTLNSLTDGLVGTDRLYTGLRVEPIPGIAGQFRCVDPAARALGCVPINPFADYTPAMVKYLAVTAGQKGEALLEDTNAYIAGSLFALPAGEVRGVFGLERRKSSGFLDYDESISRGLVTSNQILDQPLVQTKTKEAYAELLVPILADKPFAKSLSFEGAFRTTDADYLAKSISYDTFKLGAEWAPIDSLRFRVMRARAVRAPQVDDLVGGSQTFGTISDPCTQTRRTLNATRNANCAADGVAAGYAPPLNVEQSVAGFVGRNPNIDPEESRSVTFGIVYTPEALPRFLVSLDRFEIDIEGIIGSVGRQILANRCYDTANRQDCNLITRGTNPSVPGATYVLTAVNDTTANLATQDIAGYDLNLQYRYDFGNYGKAAAKLLWTRYDRADLYTDTTSAVVDLLGFAGGSTSDQGYIKNTANLDIDYDFRDFSVNWNVRYIGSAEMSPFLVGAGFPSLSSASYHSLRVSYDRAVLGATKTQFYVGMTNVFDKDPPFFATSSSGTQALDTIPGYYDVFGRSYYAGMKVKF